ANAAQKSSIIFENFSGSVVICISVPPAEYAPFDSGELGVNCLRIRLSGTRFALGVGGPFGMCVSASTNCGCGENSTFLLVRVAGVDAAVTGTGDDTKLNGISALAASAPPL